MPRSVQSEASDVSSVNDEKLKQMAMEKADAELLATLDRDTLVFMRLCIRSAQGKDIKLTEFEMSSLIHAGILDNLDPRLLPQQKEAITNLGKSLEKNAKAGHPVTHFEIPNNLLLREIRFEEKKIEDEKKRKGLVIVDNIKNEKDIARYCGTKECTEDGAVSHCGKGHHRHSSTCHPQYFEMLKNVQRDWQAKKNTHFNLPLVRVVGWADLPRFKPRKNHCFRKRCPKYKPYYSRKDRSIHSGYGPICPVSYIDPDYKSTDSNASHRCGIVDDFIDKGMWFKGYNSVHCSVPEACKNVDDWHLGIQHQLDCTLKNSYCPKTSCYEEDVQPECTTENPAEAISEVEDIRRGIANVVWPNPGVNVVEDAMCPEYVREHFKDHQNYAFFNIGGARKHFLTTNAIRVQRDRCRVWKIAEHRDAEDEYGSQDDLLYDPNSSNAYLDEFYDGYDDEYGYDEDYDGDYGEEYDEENDEENDDANEEDAE